MTRRGAPCIPAILLALAPAGRRDYQSMTLLAMAFNFVF